MNTKGGSTISNAHRVQPLTTGKLADVSKNLNQQFAKAASPKPHTPPGGEQGIATSAELKQRLTAQKPKPVLQPKPPASVAPAVHKQVAEKSQQRITHLKTTLGTAQNRFERDFSKSRDPKR